mgnify:CR=1 FL=1
MTGLFYLPALPELFIALGAMVLLMVGVFKKERSYETVSFLSVLLLTSVLVIINLDNISRTQLGAVRNDITINYNYNYGQDQNLSHINTSDGTSQGTGVGGIQEEFKLELDADSIIDETTATQLADAYLTILKDRKEIIDFTCLTPRYNDLEIGDIINFSNWDSNISIYGSAMGGYWMITEISKSIKSTKIKVIKVST